MKKLINKMQFKMMEAGQVARNVMNRSRAILVDQRGEGTISQAISILTAVVLGSLLLMGLYALIGNIVLPELQNRIQEMFNYAG